MGKPALRPQDISDNKNGRNHANGILLYVFSCAFAGQVPRSTLTAFSLLTQTHADRRMGQGWHPRWVDGDAEAELPHGKVSPGSRVSQGSLSASGLHRVTFCCQVPSCAEVGAASDKLPRAFWSRIRSELWLRQDEWVGECGCP